MEENCITINKKIVEKIKFLEVTGDIIVPDIKPDIVNIINTNGNVYICKEEVSEGKLRIDGNIDTYIVYLSDNGETRSISSNISFLESIEDEKINSSTQVKYKVFIENMDTKVLNERKISTKVKIKIKLEFFEKTNITIFKEENEDLNIEKLKESMNIKSIVDFNRTKATIKEDISVDTSLDIAEILKVSVQIENTENKISYNKILTKADAKIKIIFLTEDEKIKVVENNIPVMSFVDMEKVSENNCCQVEYVMRNMAFKVNSKEMHSINCQIDYDIICEAYENKNIEIIQDMYGIKEDIKFSKKEIDIQTEDDEKIESMQITENILIEDINTILDVNCNPVILNTNASGSFISYEGEIKTDFYYEADNRNGLNVKSVNLPFIAKLEKNKIEKEIEINVSKKQFKVNNENVECDLELTFKHSQKNIKKINIIENIEKESSQSESDYKMYIYFVKSGDTIWEIAKKFKVCMSDIIKLNNLEDPNRLSIGDRLYIMR